MVTERDDPDTQRVNSNRIRHATAVATTGIALLLAGVVTAGPVAAAVGPPTFSLPNDPTYNSTSYWEGQGYGTCRKDDAPSTPYVLGAAPTGQVWSLIIVKAGGNNLPTANEGWVDPVPGSYAHTSGKSNSHVITCYKPVPPTTTTTTSTTVPSTTSTTSTTTSTTVPSTTSTTSTTTSTTVPSTTSTTTTSTTSTTSSTSSTTVAPTTSTTVAPTTSTTVPSPTVAPATTIRPSTTEASTAQAATAVAAETTVPLQVAGATVTRSGGASLAYTGNSSSLLLVFGGGLLLVGMALLGGATRRRNVA